MLILCLNIILCRWDVKTKQWSVAESLRPLLVNVDYQKGGKMVVTKAIHFAGYIGVITGMKPVRTNATVNITSTRISQ